MWDPPRESKTSTRESRAKAARKLRERGASRQSGESSGESSQIVEMHWTIHVQDHLQVMFRESNRERYYETNVAAKAKTARAKEPRKASRKLMRTRTKWLPGFRRCSVDVCHEDAVTFWGIIVHLTLVAVYKVIKSPFVYLGQFVVYFFWQQKSSWFSYPSPKAEVSTSTRKWFVVSSTTSSRKRSQWTTSIFGASWVAKDRDWSYRTVGLRHCSSCWSSCELRSGMGWSLVLL